MLAAFNRLARRVEFLLQKNLTLYHHIITEGQNMAAIKIEKSPVRPPI
jgi:hypothetical protein